MFKSKLLLSLMLTLGLVATAEAGTWQSTIGLTPDKTVQYPYTSPPPYDLAYPYSSSNSGTCATGAVWKYYTLIPPAYTGARRGIKFFTQRCI